MIINASMMKKKDFYTTVSLLETGR